MTNQTQTRTATHDMFVLERVYPHKPEKVFAAFSDPNKKRRWFGAEEEGFEIKKFEMNFRVGQVETWEFNFKGGEPIVTEVRYQDIVENSRIVVVYTMDFGGKRVSSSQVTTELIPTKEGTKLIHTEQGVFFDGCDQAPGRKEGTQAMLETLAKELDKN